MGITASKKKRLGHATDQDTRKPVGIVAGKQYKLVFVGEGGVGKTSISIRFVSDRFVTDYDPTVEDAYKKEYEIEGKEITLEILDTAGQDEYVGVNEGLTLRVGDGFLCVYSITSRESFQRIKELREKILWAKDENNIPMIIVGNKSDMEKDRQVSVADGKLLAEQFNCPFIETSAKTNSNIKECIDMILKEITSAPPSPQS